MQVKKLTSASITRAIACATVLACFLAPALADEVKAGDLVITQAWSRATPGGAKIGGGYLTIENKGPIPREFREAIGNRIYGCDDCLAVCPWNKFAQVARETAFHPRLELTAPLLRELALLDDAGFREIFRGSPIKPVVRASERGVVRRGGRHLTHRGYG